MIKPANRSRPNLNGLITAVAAVIATIPGLSQLKEIKLLPDYWDKGNLIAGVVTMLLSYVVVFIFYIYRNDLKKTARKTVVKRAIWLFCGFLFSVLAFFILRQYCIFKDEDGEEVFIPVVLMSYLEEKVNSPEVNGRQNWVNMDGAPAVTEQINALNGATSSNVTMTLFFLLYLILFILLISTILTLGFHIASGISFNNQQKE